MGSAEAAIVGRLDRTTFGKNSRCVEANISRPGGTHLGKAMGCAEAIVGRLGRTAFGRSSGLCGNYYWQAGLDQIWGEGLCGSYYWWPGLATFENGNGLCGSHYWSTNIWEVQWVARKLLLGTRVIPYLGEAMGRAEAIIGTLDRTQFARRNGLLNYYWEAGLDQRVVRKLLLGGWVTFFGEAMGCAEVIVGKPAQTTSGRGNTFFTAIFTIITIRRPKHNEIKKTFKIQRNINYLIVQLKQVCVATNAACWVCVLVPNIFLIARSALRMLRFFADGKRSKKYKNWWFHVKLHAHISFK